MAGLPLGAALCDQLHFEDAVQRTDAEGIEFWFARDL
jgi:hypothetical protein